MRRAVLLVTFAPAFVLAPLSAQTPVSADAALHAAPNGAAIGTLKRGATVRTGRTTGGWTSVTIEGWVASTRLQARRDTLDRTVAGRGLAPLRAADGPGQSVVAELDPGTLLKRLSDRNGWTHVRRSAWVRASALERAASSAARGASGGASGGARGTAARATASPPPRPNTQASAPPAGRGDAEASPPALGEVSGAATMQRLLRATTVRGNPGGDERATVRAGVSLETLSREGGWARVRLEGWVPERDLMLADSAADVQLSAADVRANPAAHRGKIVRWSVEVVSVQRADALRRALAPNEPYILARGPGDEGTVLYVAIPPALLDQVRALVPLTDILITARVRDGRSPPIGAPLLDLISFTKLP